MRTQIFRVLSASFVLLFSVHAAATVMNVQISGYVSEKPSAFATTTPVKVGDTFSFNLAYDDTQQSVAQVTANDDLYTIVTQPFSPTLLSWTGTLPDEIASFNTLTASGSLSGWGYEQSWFRPPGTLHHNDWQITSGMFTGNQGQRGFTIFITTNYAGELGRGWWAIGSTPNGGYGSETIDYGYFDVTGLSVTPAVPEPPVAGLLLFGLAVIAVSRRRGSPLASRQSSI